MYLLNALRTMVFFVLGAVKAAQVLKNEWEKDTERKATITPVEGSAALPLSADDEKQMSAHQWWDVSANPVSIAGENYIPSVSLSPNAVSAPIEKNGASSSDATRSSFHLQRGRVAPCRLSTNSCSSPSSSSSSSSCVDTSPWRPPSPGCCADNIAIRPQSVISRTTLPRTADASMSQPAHATQTSSISASVLPNPSAATVPSSAADIRPRPKSARHKLATPSPKPPAPLDGSFSAAVRAGRVVPTSKSTSRACKAGAVLQPTAASSTSVLLASTNKTERPSRHTGRPADVIQVSEQRSAMPSTARRRFAHASKTSALASPAPGWNGLDSEVRAGCSNREGGRTLQNMSNMPSVGSMSHGSRAATSAVPADVRGNERALGAMPGVLRSPQGEVAVSSGRGGNSSVEVESCLPAVGALKKRATWGSSR